MPNYYGFDDVVIEGLNKYSNCEVANINYDVGFTYTNIFQRLDNAFSKVFLGRNKKPYLKERYFFQMVSKFETIDYLLVNRPDILPSSVLNKALEKAEVSKLLLWDSLEKVPVSKEIWQRFDQIYSFDKRDCETYGFIKINNFHFYKAEENDPPINNDALFLGTVDSRIKDLEKLMDYLIRQGLNAQAVLHVPRERELTFQANVTVLDKIVPFNKSDVFAKSTRIIIDLAHKNQVGLSFRVYEAMALGKKLITTNVHIKNYDFYDDRNIFVIEDINNIVIPPSFFEENYFSLSPYLVEKYSIKSWVEEILKGNEA